MLYLEEVKKEVNNSIVGANILLYILPKIQNELKSFINKKVVKNDGFMVAKLDKIISDIIDNKKAEYIRNKDFKDTYSLQRFYIKQSYSRFELFFTICYSVGNGTGCYYKDHSFIVGRIDGDVLVSLNDDYSDLIRKANYDYDQIARQIAVNINKLKEVEELQKNLPYYAKFTLPFLGNINA